MRRIKWYNVPLLIAFTFLILPSRAVTQQPAQSLPQDREAVSLSCVLVIDNSASLRSQLPLVINAGKILVNNNRPTDETALVRFVGADQIKALQDFTGDTVALNAALDGMYVEFGGTAILDAIDFAARRLAQHRLSEATRLRPALILITDGDERTSFYKLEALLQRLHQSKVPIYVIGLTGELENEKTKVRAMRLLDTLARETGGHAYYPGSLSDVGHIAETIMTELHKP